MAGSGKTSALSAVRAGFEAAGYKVIGAATSGQAAKALEEGFRVSSRTVASLTWRLDHHRQALGTRHVLVLDESGMTTDADVAKLLGAVKASGARPSSWATSANLTHRPGGRSRRARHPTPSHVWALRDNLRQRDPAERQAVEHLRAGDLASAAVGWYALHGRVHPAARPN